MIEMYTPLQWADFEGLTLADLQEEYGEDVTAFYAKEDGAYAGCQHADGTCDVFGCRRDIKGITYEQMLEYLDQ